MTFVNCDAGNTHSGKEHIYFLSDSIYLFIFLSDYMNKLPALHVQVMCFSLNYKIITII